ncbi:nicotinate phosphoribosyltransferase [Roridomyces roridus]|uniref:Nicotinate phosphoribosyltransferase n=1 Tax=Roridomyces roridus TaxID=1738132 RepID=A0AAD7CJM5_9AGAR|nr:nicotinate phosphoribosyltransferase [Roridomyces roridus]
MSLLPRSLLDTDLYKLTMQQAVLHHFPDTRASYKFTLRDKSVNFTKGAFEIFKDAVSQFDSLALTEAEYLWLKQTCPYLTESYLSYLRSYRFKPAEQVRVTFVSEGGETGQIEIDVSGSWVETIFWEVPLMATLSEVYFTSVKTDWTYDGQKELAYEKGRALLEHDCVFSEFGTRRRRLLVSATKDIASKGRLSGTSNVHLAHKHGILPVAALKGYENANSIAMDLWEEVYPNALLIALTDTFSSSAFFESFRSNKERAMRWQGLRQDSGDPFEFGVRAKEVLESLGIEPSSKMIIYSDALDIEKAVGLQQQARDLGLTVSFGIGTTGTDEKSKALNMVIKLSSVDDRPCVKISDDLNKNTGNAETVLMVKQLYKLS